MRKLFMAGAAAISMAMVPAAVSAQDDDGMAMAVEMSAEQQAMYDGWPADRQGMYDDWPSDLQTYYWTLDDTQTEGWWMLTNEQRGQLYALPMEQRNQAWASIRQQLAARSSDTAMSATSTATPTASASARAMPSTRAQGNVTFEGREMAQRLPASASPRAQGSEYPVCRGDQQDSCIQPRAAGMNWGNRPLDYWPGEPASSRR